MLKEKGLHEIALLIQRYPELSSLVADITCGIELLCSAVRAGGKILICGNGGSAADSLHIVGELMKGFVLERKISAPLQDRLWEEFPDDAAYYIENLQGTIPAISLVNEVSLITAYSNDKCADLVFAQQVMGYGSKNDVLIAISTSGNSTNILHAAKIAKALDMKVLSLTGQAGGKLAKLSDVLLAVPASSTYQIQELHLPVYHTICLAAEAELFFCECET